MSYFTPDFIDYFKRLERNNNRDWFHAHKKEYEEAVKEPFAVFVDEIIHRVGQLDPNIALEPKEAIFRIVRDIRFSKDKTPYKTFVAAVITPGGRKDRQYPGLYLSLGINGVGIAGGLYQPEKDHVLKIRQAITRDGETLERALRGKAFREYFGELQGERNKRLPKEFQDVVDRFPYVANKQFYYWAQYDDPATVLRPDLGTWVMRHYKASGKVRAFLQEALGV